MATKQIELVMAPGEPHFVGDGFRVHNFIPGRSRLSMKYETYGPVYYVGLQFQILFFAN